MSQPFTIYVIQSAHTDIGYTHPQEQIAQMYLEHYDKVLDLCKLTADAPAAQRFKWTCETAWQLRNYLEARPKREAELLHYVRSGQIEITASYLHFTDMIDTDALRRSLAWVANFCKQHELPLRCAMHCDINGWPWALADILAEHNIPFFCSQVHIDSATDPLGQRGSVHYHWVLEQGADLRPDVPIRIPQAFWWQGPGGQRVLHWLGEHYLLGNVLGISSPRGFHADKTRYFLETDHMAVEELYAIAQRELPRYIARLRAGGYTDNMLLLSTGGFYVDNAPPDGRWCDVIARWNAQHGDIRLRTATLGEWFDVLLAHDEGHWPTYQVAWPDAWAHGLGSATARIAQARRTQRRRAAAITLVEAAQSASATASLDAALEHERLALEHTFGAWSTSARPGSAAVDFQQAAKMLTFHRAELHLDEAIGAALRASTPASPAGPLLYASAEIAGGETRLVHFDAGDLLLDPNTQQLVGDDGQRYPFQQEQAPGYVAALPVGGRKLTGFGLVSGRATPPGSAAAMPLAIENQAWQLRVDPATGGLHSMVERATSREWVAAGQPHAFGQLVHEVVVHPRGRAAASNVARMIALDAASEQARRQFEDLPIFDRASPQMDGQPRYTPGPIYDAIELGGAHDRIGPLRVAWRCYHALPLVELVIDWEKRWSDLPEAAYVAFPFAAAGGKLMLETSGGFFQPGSYAPGGQLPGTCPAYYTIQRAARLTAPDEAALLWLPLDAPLVMPNAIDFNRWEGEPWAWNGLLASMPVNHYWHTNFMVSQRGLLRLRYRMISPRGWGNEEAAIQAALPVEAFGWR
jgi:alpha-mannosidase